MTPILLLHGIPGSAATWNQVVDVLGGERSVLVPDLLGFNGNASDTRGDDLLAPNQAAYVLDRLDRRNVDRVIVGAHDFGGPVAAHIAAQDPDRVAALALFATNVFPDTPIPFPLSMLTAPVIGGTVERLMFSRPSLAMMVKQGMGNPKPSISLDDYLGDRTQTAAIGSIFSSSLRRIEELYRPVEEALRSMTVPAIVGWGDQDPFFTVATGERTGALIPGAEFRLYEGAGHFLPEERPEELAGAVLELAESIG